MASNDNKKNDSKKKKPDTYGRLMRDIGALVGGAKYGPIGAYAGRLAGAGLSKITGHGKYKIRSITNQKSKSIRPKSFNLSQNQVPFMNSMKDGFKVRHREYIGDVVGSTLFSATTYLVNPGLNTSFPWLSNIASNFEQYRFSGLVYEFKSTCGDALSSTNNALGTVILTADYNVTTPAFASKVEAENSMWCSSTKPSRSVIMPVECKSNFNPMSQLYIRSTTIQPNQNKQFYDLCQLQVATQGMQIDNVVIGELWCSYEVQLFKPIVNSLDPQTIGSAHYNSSSYTNVAPLIGCNKIIDTLGITVSGNNILFDANTYGIFSISFYWAGTAVTFGVPSFTYTPNIYSQPIYANSTVAQYSNTGQTSAATGFCQINFQVFNDGNISSITLGSGTLPTGSRSLDFVVMQLNSSFQ